MAVQPHQHGGAVIQQLWIVRIERQRLTQGFLRLAGAAGAAQHTRQDHDRLLRSGRQGDGDLQRVDRGSELAQTIQDQPAGDVGDGIQRVARADPFQPRHLLFSNPGGGGGGHQGMGQGHAARFQPLRAHEGRQRARRFVLVHAGHAKGGPGIGTMRRQAATAQ